MKGVLALTVSLIALAVWSSPASAATSGRVCLVSGQCGTFTAQLVSAAHPYSGAWPGGTRPEAGLASGQAQVDVQLQWDEANPSVQDMQAMQQLVFALPLTLHVDGTSTALSQQLDLASDYVDVCLPVCDDQPGHYYTFFQLDSPIDLTSMLTGSGQHSVSASIGYANVDTNTITLGGKPASGGNGKQPSGGPQVCDSNGLCGTVKFQLDLPDSPEWYEQYAPSPFDLQFVDGTIAARVTVTFSSSGFVSQDEVRSSDLFSKRPLTLHVGSRSYPMKPLVLGSLPSNPDEMWCSPCKETPSYFAVWVLAPVKLSSYRTTANAKVWLSTVADNGATISSDSIDLTGSSPLSGNHLTVTKLGPRTVKVTLTSAQLVEPGAHGRLLFLATRYDGTNWIRYRLTNKLVRVDGKHSTLTVIFHLPGGGRWCFEELGAIVYGGRPHSVYAAPRYLTPR